MAFDWLRALTIYRNFFNISRLFCASLCVIACLSTSHALAQKYDELALTPPMGWNTWNKFRCNINEQMVREMADAMVATGMKEAGYTYINIDDCWHGERSPLGNIWPHPKRFPSGIKVLADYVHSKGLKLGIYSDAGTRTCAGYPGSLGFERQDALTYADWGIDYLKYDWCNTEGLSAPQAYQKMSEAIRAAGRPMVFSICEWGDNNPAMWAPAIGHSWRTTPDIFACWDCNLGDDRTASWSILKILDQQAGLRNYSGPGRWNDMDMLEVGNGITDTQGRSHFTLWSIMNSPLITGNDLRSMSAATIATLTNKNIIALNQDPLGIQALHFQKIGLIDVYLKPLMNNEWALVILNRGKKSVDYHINWSDYAAEDELSKRVLSFDKKHYKWINLWSNRVGETKTPLVETIASHDVLALRLIPTP